MTELLIMEFQRIFKALADPPRREFLNISKDCKRKLADEIDTYFDLSQATTSHHLSILKKGKFDYRIQRIEVYHLCPY